MAVTLTREGAEDFGNIVIVHYSFTRIDTYPDGRVEGAWHIVENHAYLDEGGRHLANHRRHVRHPA